MGKMYRAQGKNPAAKKGGKRGWDEHPGLNAHGQYWYNSAYFLLSTKEIPEGPQKPFANQDQASPGCSSCWIIPYPSGSYPTKVQASAIGKNIKINSKKSPGDFALEPFQCFPHPGIFKLGNMRHHHGSCSAHHWSN